MSTTNNRLKLLAILALFIVPLLAAALMFSGHLPMLTGDTVNQGTLIQPPVPLDWSVAEPLPDPDSESELEQRWVILMPLPDVCADECMEKISGLRQVHKATGRNQDRIAVALLAKQQLDDASRQELLAIYDRFVLLDSSIGMLWNSIHKAQQQGKLDQSNLISYLVDPLGNIMMAYDTVDSDTRLSKDLKRLLTWSKQDKG